MAAVGELTPKGRRLQGLVSNDLVEQLDEVESRGLVRMGELARIDFGDIQICSDEHFHEFPFGHDGFFAIVTRVVGLHDAELEGFIEDRVAGGDGGVGGDREREGQGKRESEGDDLIELLHFSKSSL